LNKKKLIYSDSSTKFVGYTFRMTQFLKFAILTCAVLAVAFASTDGKCRALIFAATTDAGAYHAGVIDGILKNAADLSDYAYDVVIGSSVGGLNAAVFSQYPAGQETQASEALLNLWTTITRDNVYDYWAGGYVEGLLFKTSLVDSSPFQQYLQNKLKTPLQRKVVIGASDADNGNFTIWNEANLLHPSDLARVLVASTAIPLYFPYVDFNSQTYIDGSLIDGTDIPDAVNRCMEIVSNHSDIIIDIVSTHDGHPVNVDASNYNTMEMLQRFLEIYLYANENFQYYLARLDYPDVNFRHVIQPSESLPGSFNPLGFDSENMASDIAIGQKDGAAAMANGMYGNGLERMEKAVEWLHKNHGMFSKGIEKVKAINDKLRAKRL